MNGLSPLSPQLAQEFASASLDQKRNFAVSIVAWALGEAKVTDPESKSALQMVKANEIVPRDLRDTIANFAEEADEKYFALKGDVDGSDSYDSATDAWFRRGRALEALRDACDGVYDEAIYVASSAGDIPSVDIISKVFASA